MSHAPARRPDKTRSEKINGETVTAQIYSGHRTWEAVVVIKRGNDRWTLGIDDDATAHVEKATATVIDLDGEVDAPDWIEQVLLGMEIKRIEA